MFDCVYWILDYSITYSIFIGGFIVMSTKNWPAMPNCWLTLSVAALNDISLAINLNFIVLFAYTATTYADRRGAGAFTDSSRDISPTNFSSGLSCKLICKQFRVTSTNMSPALFLSNNTLKSLLSRLLCSVCTDLENSLTRSLMSLRSSAAWNLLTLSSLMMPLS